MAKRVSRTMEDAIREGAVYALRHYRQATIRNLAKDVITLSDELRALRAEHNIITGDDADRIRAEIRDGTPDTPQRIETMRRADETYARSKGSIELHRELAQKRIDDANHEAREKERRTPAGRRSEGGE